MAAWVTGLHRALPEPDRVRDELSRSRFGVKGFISRAVRKGISVGMLALAAGGAAPAVVGDDTDDLARKAADPTASLMSLDLRDLDGLPEWNVRFGLSLLVPGN